MKYSGNWDPIGINNESEAHDEYQPYIGGIYKSERTLKEGGLTDMSRLKDGYFPLCVFLEFSRFLSRLKFFLALNVGVHFSQFEPNGRYSISSRPQILSQKILPFPKNAAPRLSHASLLSRQLVKHSLQILPYLPLQFLPPHLRHKH